MHKIIDAYKTFYPGTPNEVRALRGINLTIEPGQFTIVIGSNGSGKSTLLSAFAGTFYLDEGQVLMDGTDVTDWPEHRRAQLVGRVFQDPFAGTAPRMTIAENFALAARRGKGRFLGWAMKPKLIEEFKDTVRGLNMGLENRLNNPIGSLSGGQRQALTLLMATWLKPKLLLLDEHTAALDPKSADQVIRLSDHIIRRDNLTTLMVTHSMQQAANLGDRLVMMHRGRIIRDYQGVEKARIRPEDLLETFAEVRRQDQFDEPAGAMVRAGYV